MLVLTQKFGQFGIFTDFFVLKEVVIEFFQVLHESDLESEEESVL